MDTTEPTTAAPVSGTGPIHCLSNNYFPHRFSRSLNNLRPPVPVAHASAC
jgi:hypothetical protein